MAVNWKSLRAGLLWILFSPLMFMSGVMADSTSSNLEYEIQVVICGTWSVFGVISGIGTIAGASWAVRVQTVLVWIVYAAFAVFGVAIVFYGVRITAGPLWAIAAVLFLTGIVYAMRRQSSGTEMEVEERRRAALKRAHARLFAAVARALRESDPMDLIAMGAPSDEYEPAVGSIIPRLESATSVDDVQNIVHEEFAQWFTSVDAGPPDRYRNAATTIWNAYQSHR